VRRSYRNFNHDGFRGRDFRGLRAWKEDFRGPETKIADLALLKASKSEPMVGDPDECDNSVLRRLYQAEMQLGTHVGQNTDTV
jgi:hypothetical protein